MQMGSAAAHPPNSVDSQPQRETRYTTEVHE